jgi:3,4-dihydroxy 2-butanone 4-phosphate synthase / GTP cyclohydrolase II
MVNFMARQARGLICLAMTGDRLDQLKLPAMVHHNTDTHQTAFTVSIDAVPKAGESKASSAEGRSRTIQAAIDSATPPCDLRRPGQIFPLRAKDRGVLERPGHTEAAVDLARLAGLYPAGVICEIQNPDGSMARLPQLIAYARQHRLKLITIAALIQYRLQRELTVTREAVANLPTQFGQFQIYGYRNGLDGSEAAAIVKGNPADFGPHPILTRVHSECLTGESLGSLRCDCREQLHHALQLIEKEGQGVIVYLRQEGRGIGLVNKLKAYSLQDQGFDTVTANQALGFQTDLRDFGIGAQILKDLGIRSLRLLTNNPIKLQQLQAWGLVVVERVPLAVPPNVFSHTYLTTKLEKLGHWL